MAEEASKEVVITKDEKAVAPAIYNPLQSMERFFEDLMGRGWMRPLPWDRLFGDFSPMLMPTFDVKGTPNIDVIDGDEAITVRAELPGVEKGDVKVTLAGNLITIKAETKRETKEDKGALHRSEIYRGSYLRTVTLPSEAKASMKDGVLEVVMPKVEATKRHSIKVA